MDYKFKAVFTKGGAAYAPSPAPTITIVDTSNNIIVNAAAVTALSNMPGAYVYVHSSGSALDLIARFRTSDTTADETDVYSYTPDVITHYVDASIAAVKAKTDNLPSDPADQSALEALINAIPAGVWASGSRTLSSFGTLVADVWSYATRVLTSFGTLETSVDAVKAKTDNLPSDPADQSALEALINAIPAGVWSSGSRTLTSFGGLETKIDAVKAKTDNLPSDPADQSALEAEFDNLPAAVWSNSSRTLTQTAAQVAAALSGSTLTITNRVTFEATLTGLSIPSTWTEIYLTAKDNITYPDNKSVLQIKVSNPADETDGINYLLRSETDDTTRGYGNLVVDQESGTIDITIQDNADLSSVPSATYDIKCLLNDGTSLLLVSGGSLRVHATPTQAV